MTPTIGRTVLYRVAPGDRYLRGSDTLPAKIVRVHDSTCVNLRVEPDRHGYSVWKERVVFGAGPGQWEWCEKEKGTFLESAYPNAVTAPQPSPPPLHQPSILREVPGWRSPAVEGVADLPKRHG